MLLRVLDLEKIYPTEDGPLAVLRGVSLDLAAGETVALTGESGSGKSTLLYLVAGLDGWDLGSIEIDGKPVSRMDDAARAAMRRDTIGIVFQQFNLVPSLDVRDNLRLAARLAGREDAAWTAELSHRLGLNGHMARYPEQLSGGQQQRVAIGRALASRPKLLLADEPTGNLDEDTAADVVNLLAELAAETGAGLLTVTHSQRLAARMGRRLHLRRGTIEAVA
ncbi:ABC transporter ATP-binding protein [Rhizobiaceae bacterium]|nr:ABC transporter ATP-binding protein [Rhizobiaceae bacterium]